MARNRLPSFHQAMRKLDAEKWQDGSSIRNHPDPAGDEPEDHSPLRLQCSRCGAFLEEMPEGALETGCLYCPQCVKYGHCEACHEMKPWPMFRVDEADNLRLCGPCYRDHSRRHKMRIREIMRNW